MDRTGRNITMRDYVEYKGALEALDRFAPTDGARAWEIAELIEEINDKAQLFDGIVKRNREQIQGAKPEEKGALIEAGERMINEAFDKPLGINFRPLIKKSEATAIKGITVNELRSIRALGLLIEEDKQVIPKS